MTRAVRVALGLIVAALLVLLAVGQTVSDMLAHDAARPGSLIGFLPSGVDPRWPLLPFQRVLLARHDLAVGDLSAAERQATRLARSPARDDLEAQLAQRRGDRATAIAKYFAAGDIDGLEAIVTERESARDYRRALSLQRAIVEDLVRSGLQTETLGEAWWRLAVLYAIVGDRTPAERTSDDRAALAADERAIELAPFSQKYLLNAAYRAVGLGDLDAAARWYDRVRATNPKSVDAILGQAKVAWLRGHRDEARAKLATARSIDPTLPEIPDLLRQFQRPGEGR